MVGMSYSMRGEGGGGIHCLNFSFKFSNVLAARLICVGISKNKIKLNTNDL